VFGGGEGMRETALVVERPGVTRTFPVIEMFGPTIQGEGPDAGLPCQFIRFGGCDYRCSWCDSMYAVEPAEVREHAEKLTSQEIVERLLALPGGAPMVVLSGGNPALLELGPLVMQLQGNGLTVSVETQGSRWRDWLIMVDRLVVSPKPPSSGMATADREVQTEQFMMRAESHPAVAAKVVVFDRNDYEWAVGWHWRYPRVPFYLSVGSPVGLDDEQTRREVLRRLEWLCEVVANDRRARRAVVLPQLHVLAWGTRRGV